MRYWIKIVLVVLSCITFGCVKGPLPEPAAWPWEHSKDYGNNQTGDYFTFRGNVANFGDPPKAVKPVSPDALQPHNPEGKATPDTPKNPSVPLPSNSEAGSYFRKEKTSQEYNFTVRDVKVAPPSYLPSDTVRSVHEITAYNRGNAPVSVTIGVDPSSHNITTDKVLPYYAVVPPHSDQALLRIGPKNKDESYSFNYSYSWNIGDYTVRHNCPERYRFPFANDVEAFASVSDDANTSLFTRYAVIFSLPVDTPVHAARRGVVVKVRNDKVDILHDDSTIATYGHLGKIAEDIMTGKAVSAGDIIGVVGTTTDKKEGFVQLTVWRPEQIAVTAIKTVSDSAGFDYISFPMEFCHTDAGDCRVIAKDQIISGNKMGGSKKPSKRKAKVKGP